MEKEKTTSRGWVFLNKENPSLLKNLDNMERTEERLAPAPASGWVKLALVLLFIACAIGVAYLLLSNCLNKLNALAD